jgi:hypothetical protein
MNNALRTFFEAIKAYMPSGLTITYPSVIEQVDSTTGAIENTVGVSPPADTTCSAGLPYAAPTGVLVHWRTGVYLDRHEVRGRTYLVPWHGGVGSAGGTPFGGDLSAVRAAAAALIATPSVNLAVWHRPRDATPTKPARTGACVAATSSSVPNKYVVLTSRRD